MNHEGWYLIAAMVVTVAVLVWATAYRPIRFDDKKENPETEAWLEKLKPIPEMEKPVTLKKNLKFIVCPNGAGEFFWHIIGGNNKIRSTSGESFASKGNARRALVTLLRDLGVDTNEVEIKILDEPVD